MKDNSLVQKEKGKKRMSVARGKVRQWIIRKESQSKAGS